MRTYIILYCLSCKVPYIYFILFLLCVAFFPTTQSLAQDKISPLLEWTTWEQVQDPILIARRITSPPIIDGIPNEEVWLNAVWSDGFMDMVDASKPWLSTEVALLYDDVMLYVAVRMQEPYLEARITERDGQVYRDQDFEIFVAGNDNYWELEINPYGTIYDVFWIWDDALSKKKGHDPKYWDVKQSNVLPLSGIGEHKHPRGQRQGFIDENMQGLLSAVSLQGTLNDNSDKDKGWSVELAIPWNILSMVADGKSIPPQEGEIWRMNLSRFVNRNVKGEALPMLRPAGWTLTRHGVFDSHIPERFAPILFTEMSPDAAILRAYLNKHLAAETRAQLGEKAEDFITTHADFVAQVVSEAPWKNKLKADLIKNYLLPYTVTRETLEPWTIALRKELFTGIQQLPQANDMRAVALYIRQWVAQQAVPGQSHPWSMGPLTLMKAGAGRCEELGILYVCAARAVGLPARIVYTPMWRTVDGNHLWVEFWNGQKWEALSIEQIDSKPNEGWFYPLLQKGAIVLSRGFGEAPAQLEQDESLIHSEANSFSINRTAAYLPTGTARIMVQDAKGQAISAIVKAHIFNSGRPRAVLSEQGNDVQFTLGTGSYLFTVVPLKDKDDVSIKTQQKESKSFLPYMFVLQLKKDEKIQHIVNVNMPQSRSLSVLEKRGYTKLNVSIQQVTVSLAQRPLPADVDGLKFTDSLYANVTTLQAERQAASKAFNVLYDDAIEKNKKLFVLYVQNGRVSIEPFSHWRLPMSELLEQTIVLNNIESTITALSQRLDNLFAQGKIEITGFFNIEGLLRTRPKLTNTQKALLSVAALRTSGIVARLAPQGANIYTSPFVWAEYFNGTQWKPFIFGNKDKQISSIVQAYYAQWQTFLLQEKGVKAVDYGRKWSICSLTSQGNFGVASVYFDTKGSIMYVPQGEYFLVKGQRDNDGWSTWTVEPLE